MAAEPFDLDVERACDLTLSGDESHIGQYHLRIWRSARVACPKRDGKGITGHGNTSHSRTLQRVRFARSP